MSIVVATTDVDCSPALVISTEGAETNVTSTGGCNGNLVFNEVKCRLAMDDGVPHRTMSTWDWLEGSVVERGVLARSKI